MAHLQGYRDCVKQWASGEREYGRSGGHRMYYRGATLYSYGDHYPMARIALVNGWQAALVNSTQDSATTNKHMNIVRTIVSRAFERERIFNIPTHALKARNEEAQHTEVIEHYKREARMWYEKSRTARSKKDEYIARALTFIDEANAYAKFYGIADPLFLVDAPDAVRFAHALGDSMSMLEFFIKRETK